MSQDQPTVNITDRERLEKIAEQLSQNKENGLRVLSEMSRQSILRTKLILDRFPIDDLIDLIANNKDDNLMAAFQYLVQTFFNTLRSAAENKVDEDRSILLNILMRLIKRSASYIITAIARDTMLALVMSNLDYKALNFGIQLVEQGCIENLLDIASEVEELKSPSSMEITPMTHSLVAAVLERIYTCHDYDKAREIFREQTQAYLNKRLHNPDIDDKVRATKVMTVLLTGPTEIGNSCVGQPGMIEMIVTMASMDEYTYQKIALDAMIAAASKKDKCTAITKHGEKILDDLRQSENEDIRLRALVTLSKVSSVGSTDASIRPFSQEAMLNFSRDCINVVSRPTPEICLKQYAIEALAYLSFDGDVKEELVDNKNALLALFESLTFNTNSPVVYSILNIFVNLTNSYEKPEHSPELLELAKFAKQHIPVEHPKDNPQILKQRIEKLASVDLVPSLVQLSNIKSKSAKELLSRIMNAMCEIESIRGCLIQQGAVKLLMYLTQSDSKKSEKSCIIAAQALARLGITIDPELAYSGQRLLAVIRPLKRLLEPECTALQNFEGLLALTNIAQASEDARAQILNDNGFSLIEALMFEDHNMIRRAAVQCVANLVRDSQMISFYEAENDRVKYLLILCQDDDIETVKAASGALAMLCQVSEKACKRIFSAKQWKETLITLLSSENVELVHRAVVVVNCVVLCEDTSLAKKIFESEIFEVLLALTLKEVGTPQNIRDIAQACLNVGNERELIRKN